MLTDLRRRLADKQLHLTVTDAAKAAIIDGGYDPIYGARPLKRYIQAHVETMIAREIIAGAHSGRGHPDRRRRRKRQPDPALTNSQPPAKPGAGCLFLVQKQPCRAPRLSSPATFLSASPARGTTELTYAAWAAAPP